MNILFLDQPDIDLNESRFNRSPLMAVIGEPAVVLKLLLDRKDIDVNKQDTLAGRTAHACLLY